MFYIPFIFYHFQEVLFTIRVSSLLMPLNDASFDIVDYEGSFQLSPEITFPFYVHITLVTDTEAEPPHFAELLHC